MICGRNDSQRGESNPNSRPDPKSKPPVGSKPSPRLATSASPRGGRLRIPAYGRKKAVRRRYAERRFQAAVSKMVCCADVAIQSAGGDHLTAEAAGDPVRPLGRQRQSQPVHAVLPGGPVALAAPSLVVGLGPRCRQLLPCRLEAGARLVECLGNPAAVIARLAARKKPQDQPHCGAELGTPARGPINPTWTSPNPWASKRARATARRGCGKAGVRPASFL